MYVNTLFASRYGCKLLTINLFVVAVTVTERYATFYTSKDFTPIYHGKRGFP